MGAVCVLRGPSAASLVTDTFTRPNASTLGTTETGGKTWLYADDSSGTDPWTIGSNSAHPPAGHFSSIAYYDSTSVIGYVEGVISIGVGLGMGLHGVAVGWYPKGVWLYRDSSNQLQGRYTADGVSLTSLFGVSGSAGDTVRMALIDPTTVRLTVNGILLGNYPVPTITVTNVGMIEVGGGNVDNYVASTTP